MRVPPYKDEEVANETKKCCLERYLNDSMEHLKVNMEYASSQLRRGHFLMLIQMKIDIIWILIVGGLFMVHPPLYFKLWP